MRTLGIDKLRQHATEILLLRRHAEQDTFGAHIPVKSLDISDSETQFHFACRIFIGSRVQSQSGLARRELAPTRDSNFTFRPSTSRWNFTALSMSATNLMAYLSFVLCIETSSS